MYNISALIQSSDDVSRLKLPRDIDDAKDLGRLLSKYKNTHYHTVLAAMFATYVLYPEWFMSMCICTFTCIHLYIRAVILKLKLTAWGPGKMVTHSKSDTCLNLLCIIKMAMNMASLCVHVISYN